MPDMYIPYETPYCDESDGCTGGGGGGGVDSILQIGSSPPGGQDLADSVPYIVEWDDTVFGGAVFVSRGTDVSWDSGTPTVITINTTGVYDLAFLAVGTPGTDDSLTQQNPSINGSPVFSSAVWAPVAFNLTAFPFWSAPFNMNGLALTAGDEITWQIAQAGNVSNDTSLAYAVMSITRRV